MASSHNNMHSEAAKMEQIITEFYAKSLHIILESRSPYMSSRNFSGEQALSSPSSSTSSSSSVRPRDRWFNLALRECPAALENLDFWRQSNLEPMVVDVILVQRPLDWDPVNLSPKSEPVRNLSSKERYPICWSSDQEEFESEAKSEKIVERWLVQYDSRKVRDSSSGSRRSSSNTLHNVYKKSILLLRSLYATVRLLPAHKIFHDLNSSGQILTFSLAHRVSSFIETFSRKEEAEFQRFGFTPVDTTSGRLCISVLYRSSISEVSSKPSTPISPQFICDYVGSPLAEPLKRFPSLPMYHGSPSSLPSRLHSWSFDCYKPSPPSVSFSPSESHTSISNICSRPETSLVHKKIMNFDEYCPSPNFTSAPSPSPPICIPRSHPSKGCTRLANSPVLSNLLTLSPSPPLETTRSGSSKIDRGMGPTQTGATIDKLPLGKDDSRRFSRSSSRSFRDDFDDDFACPFDFEDVDLTDPGSRPESFDQKGLLSDPLEPEGLFPIRKSQDAAVGALVCKLNRAPSLRHDLSSPISEAPLGQHSASLSVASSGPVASKTTADALEELQGYKVMKNRLLSQGARSQSLANYASTT